MSPLRLQMIQLPFFNVQSSWRPTPVKDLPRWEDSRIGLDTETHDPQLTKLGPGPRRDGRIIGISFCLNSTRRPYYLPVDHESGGNLPLSHVWSYLKDQTRDFRGEIVGANMPYDLDFLAEEGVTFHPSVRFRDVQLADPLLYELHMSYSLDAIAKRRGIPTKSEAVLKTAGEAWGLANIKKEMWKLPAHHVGEYAEYDALLPLLILENQEREIAAQDLQEVWDLETDVLPISLAMRRRGVLIDQAQLTRIHDWAREVEEEELAKVRAATGVPVQFGDTSKSSLLARALEQVGLECPLTEKTKKPSVSADFLQANPHPVTDALLRAKQFAKLRTTFCKQVSENMVKGRVHCTFNQMRTQKPGQEENAGAAFGRFSSTNFNIQNQPIRNKEFGKQWRSIYVPDEGKMWACCDFSSQEPRLAVHFATLMDYPGAADTAAQYWENPDMDPHSATAAMMFPAQWDALSPYYENGGERFEEAKRVREDAKTLFLSYCYGKGKGNLCEELGFPTLPASFVSRKGETIHYRKPGPEGQAVLDQFTARVPFIPLLAKEARRRAKIRGFVLTLSGRRCRFRKFKGEYLELHKALNRVIQGSAGDQMKSSMRELHTAGISLQMTIHDEVDWSTNSIEEMRQAGRIMMDAIQLKVPSKVDIEYGDSWGNLKNKVDLLPIT